jgi:protein TonB
MAKNRPTHIAKPVYPGGLTAMKKFVAEHLKYPPEAVDARVEGTVLVRYSLDYRGKVVDARVKKGIGFGCDEEALRVVSLMRWNVPQDRKKKVRIHQDINIHFKLPKVKKLTVKQPTARATPAQPASSMQITYTSTGKIKGTVTQKEASKDKTDGGRSYSYTINW